MSQDGTEVDQPAQTEPGPDQTATGIIKDHKAYTRSNSDSTSTSTPRKRNAFSELMGPKRKQSKPNTKDIPTNGTHASRPNPALCGLLPYISNPASFPPGTIIRETPQTILIRDLYPKSQVHLLLLPRDPAFYSLTPFEAFNPNKPANTAFLSLLKEEARTAAKLAASELSRLISPHSGMCQARLNAMSSLDPASPLPPTRDFLPDIKIGVHAQPSMSTLHVHIISVDHYSPCLKNKKHYNSFNTKFFVSLEDFPFAEEDDLLGRAEQESLLKGDMKCWRCGENFENKFKQLKEHLKVEFEKWRKI